MNKKRKNRKIRKYLIIICSIIIILLTIGIINYKYEIFTKIEIKLGMYQEIPIGKYKLIEMIDDENTYSDEQITLLKQAATEITFEIYDIHNGAFKMNGEPEKITYDGKNIMYNNKEIKYTVNGNKIAIEQDEYKLVFEKSDK